MAGQGDLRPGDEGRPGDAPVGEDLCPDCSGSGERAGRTCSTCRGTGHIEEGIGGA
jgi:DnaJ-class molecular chaperone